MAGPLIGGRRPISWRLAIVVSFVAAYATARWLEGIFGVGQISGTVSFLSWGPVRGWSKTYAKHKAVSAIV